MIGSRKVIAVVPARGGSKRLPGKNTRSLGGVPLIIHSIEAAQHCAAIDKIIVSTDSKEIANVTINSGVEVDMRSHELSSDTATTIDVIKDLLKRLDEFDIVVTLQPTSPLRTSEDIQNCLDMFETREADAVISVCKAEHPPQWTNTIGKNGEMDKFISKQIKNKRSQDLGDYYCLNGAVYCHCVAKLMKSDIFLFQRNSFAYVMPSNRSVDIDTREDFELAEFYFSKMRKD